MDNIDYEFNELIILDNINNRIWISYFRVDQLCNLHIILQLKITH